MAKVITFSRQFPSYHPRKGEPTYFVEKVWISLIQEGEVSIGRVCELSQETGIGDLDVYRIRRLDLEPKHHTIRSGHRFKVGDKFSPRVWSGRPYNSKQIIIAPDIEIKKVWALEITPQDGLIMPAASVTTSIEDIAKNDGLTVEDFKGWFKDFKVPGIYQIICWNEKIEY